MTTKEIKKIIANTNDVRFPKVEESSFVHTSYFRQSNQSRLDSTEEALALIEEKLNNLSILIEP